MVGKRRRIVFDTNVFVFVATVTSREAVAAVTSRETVSARLILADRAGHFHPIGSLKLLSELSEILSRSKSRKYLSLDDAHRYVEEIRKLAELADDAPEEHDPITDDPDDDFLVVLAEAVGADALLSGNPHLTTLERAGLPTVDAFVGHYRPIG